MCREIGAIFLRNRKHCHQSSVHIPTGMHLKFEGLSHGLPAWGGRGDLLSICLWQIVRKRFCPAGIAEIFFSILKTECTYRHKPETLKEANDLIDRYIHFYNHERIQDKTGVAPLTLRHSA